MTLVKVTDRYDFQTGKDFTSYVVACTDFAIKRAIGSDRLINVPSSAFSRARQKGTEKHLYTLQPESLDEWMQWYNTDELEEPPTAPLLPTHEAPPRDPVLRAQVQEWFSSLSPRAQQVLTLRYGLSDEDERSLTLAETARIMGLTRQTVTYTERSAIEEIKALVEGRGTMVEKNGRRRVRTGMHRFKFKPPTLTSEHETIFTQAVTCLCERGIKVSGRTLAKETGKNVQVAHAFLRLHRDELPLAARTQLTHQERLALVAQVCAELEAKGERVTGARLAQVAHVHNDIALEFMRERRRESHAVQAR